MRGTPAEATDCLMENHADLVGFDTLVIVDSQGNVVWDETGCSSIHAPSSWQSIQKGVPRLDLYAQWSDACSVCFPNAHVRARMFVFASPAAGVCSYMDIWGSGLNFFLYKSLKKRFIWAGAGLKHFLLQILKEKLHLRLDLIWSILLYKSFEKVFIWGWIWFEAFCFTNPLGKASFDAETGLKHLALQIL